MASITNDDYVSFTDSPLVFGNNTRPSVQAVLCWVPHGNFRHLCFENVQAIYQNI